MDMCVPRDSNDIADSNGSNVGKVCLVGTGPGDPDLLTVGALRAMQRADVVLYDNLVGVQILELLPKYVERIYVGKRRNRHSMPQAEINQLMVDLARSGKRIVRLKGGDPFVFGRGGEEIGALADAAIPYVVIPGITAAVGAAAYAGIPLTDRRYAQSCLFVTGQLQDESIDLDWEAIARPRQTVAIYMGLVGLPLLCQQLVARGRDAETPVAVIQQGTTQDQRVLIGSLATISRIVTAADIRPPTMIIIGDVVRLHAKLAWFAPMPEPTHVHDCATIS